MKVTASALLRRAFSRRREAASRQQALKVLADLRQHPLINPGHEPTPGSANDDYWAVQAGLGGYGQP